MASTMQMLTELLTRFPPPRAHRHRPRPPRDTSSSSRNSRERDTKWKGNKKKHEGHRDRRNNIHDGAKHQGIPEQDNGTALRTSNAAPQGRVPPTQPNNSMHPSFAQEVRGIITTAQAQPTPLDIHGSVEQVLGIGRRDRGHGRETHMITKPVSPAPLAPHRELTTRAHQGGNVRTMHEPTVAKSRTTHHRHMKEEMELLQLQEEIDLETWNRTGTMIDEAPPHSAYVRKLITTAAGEYTEELPQDDTLIMNLGHAKPAPIVAMPCSCGKPGDCCMEARMLALQDILEDEERIGPDFISFASSTNAEVTREIRDTACLIARFDRKKELRIKAHWAAINKSWWVPHAVPQK